MNRASRLAALAAGLVLALCACVGDTAGDQLVEGWAIGREMENCTDRGGEAPCAWYLAAAVPMIGAPAGTTVTIHEEGVYPGGIVAVREGHGPITVVVVTAPDGSRRAAGLSCGLDEVTPPCVVVPPPRP